MVKNKYTRSNYRDYAGNPCPWAPGIRTTFGKPAEGPDSIVLTGMSGRVRCTTNGCAMRADAFVLAVNSAMTQLGWSLNEVGVWMEIDYQGHDRDSRDLMNIGAYRVRFLDLRKPRESPFRAVATFFLGNECRFILHVMKGCHTPRESLFLASIGLSAMDEFAFLPEHPQEMLAEERRILADALQRIRYQCGTRTIPGVKLFSGRERLSREIPVETLYFCDTPPPVPGFPGAELDGLLHPSDPRYRLDEPIYAHTLLAVLGSEARLRGCRRMKPRVERSVRDDRGSRDGRGGMGGASARRAPGKHERHVRDERNEQYAWDEDDEGDDPAPWERPGDERWAHSRHIPDSRDGFRRSSRAFMKHSRPRHYEWRGSGPVPQAQTLEGLIDNRIGVAMGRRLEENRVAGYDIENLNRSDEELARRERLARAERRRAKEAEEKSEQMAAEKTTGTNDTESDD